ncbi:MAG: sodium/proton-translocating pyrophosphatase, partial [bacterium]
MNEAKIVLPPIAGLDLQLLWWVLASAFVALAYGGWLAWRVMSASAGSARMQAVAQAIREGAMAYLRRQFRVMIWFVAAMAVILYLLYANLYGGLPGGNTLALGVAGAFLAGCAASYGAGFVGMMLAVRGNVRAAH